MIVREIQPLSTDLFFMDENLQEELGILLYQIKFELDVLLAEAILLAKANIF